VLLLVLGPALARPWRYFAGRDFLDAYGTQWFFWLLEQGASGLSELERSALLYHPWGKDVFLHTGGNLLDACLALPLRLLLGDVLGYNVWIALLLAGNAWAAWRLARTLGASARSSQLAALLMLLCPYVLQELMLGRPTQAFLLFPTLFLTELLRLDRPRRALLAALWLALTAWGYWYYGLLCALLALLHGFWRLAFGPDRMRSLGLHALAAVVSLVLVAPGAWPLLQALDQGKVPGLLELGDDGLLGGLQLRTVEGDAEGLFVIALGNGVGGSLLDEGGLRFNPGPRLFGILHLLLLGLGLVALRRHRGPLLCWVLLALLVAVGPAFIVGSHFLPNPVLLQLMELSDVFRRWWWPGRAIFALHLVTAVVAAVALQRLPWPRWRLPLGWLVAFLVALGGWWQGLFPLQRWEAERSPGIRCLAQAPEGAVVDLPYAKDQRHLYLQTLHEKPILGGMLSRKPAFAPEQQRTLRAENSFVALLLQLGDRRFNRGFDYEPADRQALLELGYRYVLVRTDAFMRPRALGREGMVSDWPRLRRNLERPLGEPDYEDEHLALYALQGELGCSAP